MKSIANTGQGRVSVGAVLIVIGLMLLASQFIEGFADRAWPVILILIGLILLAGAFRASGRRRV